MKKILFGSAAAILAVVGFSSFKSAHKTSDFYYFAVTSNIPLGTGGSTEIRTSQVTYESVDNPPTLTCTTGSIHDYCWIGVTVNQVTSVDFQHLKNNIETNVVQSFVTRTSI